MHSNEGSLKGLELVPEPMAVRQVFLWHHHYFLTFQTLEFPPCLCHQNHQPLPLLQASIQYSYQSCAAHLPHCSYPVKWVTNRWIGGRPFHPPSIFSPSRLDQCHMQVQGFAKDIISLQGNCCQQDHIIWSNHTIHYLRWCWCKLCLPSSRSQAPTCWYCKFITPCMNG